jgi:hypothetical protein
MLSDTEDIVEDVVYLASPCRGDASNQKTLTSAWRAVGQPQHDGMEQKNES